MVSLFVDKQTDKPTMELYQVIEGFQLPEDINISINNTRDAESGLLFKDGKLVDISLANCYTLEDMITELIRLMGEYAVPKPSDETV
ncbi:MAG: hypothetical protein ACE362_17170 [Phaeodactylibacter xiamenensis]|uniref:Uncharacterized protein n=1 Tax=Phaeodactylibacter xiamenensis TaxID=1524460 RepID=A0A098S8C5_9BACT|nr:hypothetical protein [Phaeodactylibacter xiamenensis]KGE88366.1 hypothetical protein IX84_09235 [Phaeodactylibacter xiamenensis]MCR9051135.1 hypothetical protein [bacterium]